MILQSIAALLLGATLSTVNSTDRTHFSTRSTVHVGSFSADLFKFETKVKDDGKDKAGGWQKAVAKLNFVELKIIPDTWSCTVSVGMPLRAENIGSISPTDAARMTASIATEASTEVMKHIDEWPRGLFCGKFTDKMQEMFKDKHKKLGARVPDNS